MTIEKHILELTDEWIALLQDNRNDEALRLYCEQLIPALLPELQKKYQNTYSRIPKYDGLISLLGFTPDTVVLAYKFARPETFVILHTHETAQFLETVKQYTQAPLSNFFHEPFEENPSTDIYRALEAALKRFPNKAKVAIELTGGKKTMGGALAVAAGILDIDQLYIDYKEYMPQFRKPRPSSTYIHLVENPMRLSVDLFGGVEITRAAEFFNVAKYEISRALFQEAGEKMANPRVAEICAELSRFYSFWNAFDFSSALDLSSNLFDQSLRFSHQISVWFHLDLTRLRKQIETVEHLAKEDRLSLLWNFYFSAERYEKNGQIDIAVLLYYRTLESVFDNALKDIAEEFDRSNPKYDIFKIDQEILKREFAKTHKKVFGKLPILSDLPSPIAMFDALCLLSALNSPLADKINPSRVANVAKIRNLSVYAHGLHPMTGGSIDAMRQLTTDALVAYLDIKKMNKIEDIRINFEFMELKLTKQ